MQDIFNNNNTLLTRISRGTPAQAARILGMSYTGVLKRIKNGDPDIISLLAKIENEKRDKKVKALKQLNKALCRDINKELSANISPD